MILEPSERRHFTERPENYTKVHFTESYPIHFWLVSRLHSPHPPD